jgi:hypothetical protein
MKLTYLHEVADYFQISQDEVYKVFLKHGNKIGVKILHEIDKKIVIPSIIFDGLKETITALKDSLTPYEDMVDNATFVAPIRNTSYIYYLFNDRSLIYIGQSTALLARLGTHIGDRKVFNRVYVEAVKTSSMELIEKFYIHRDMPQLNLKIMDDCEYLKELLALTTIDSFQIES